MKPFRLINQSELKALTKQCLLTLEAWNELYSLNPWTASLSLPSKNLNQSCIAIINESVLAVVANHYLEAFNYVLFGENDLSFNNSSKHLACLLFNELFKTDCAIQQAPLPSWQYLGSTSLLLTLKAGHVSLNVLLNPNWAYEKLPKLNANRNALVSLDNSLEEKKVTLNLELHPLRLPINQIANLQIGDVISLDHHINTPLSLKKNIELVAQGELGITLHHKSIVLKR